MKTSGCVVHGVKHLLSKDIVKYIILPKERCYSLVGRLVRDFSLSPGMSWQLGRHLGGFVVWSNRWLIHSALIAESRKVRLWTDRHHQYPREDLVFFAIKDNIAIMLIRTGQALLLLSSFFHGLLQGQQFWM